MATVVDKVIQSKYLGPASVLFIIGLLFVTPISAGTCSGSILLQLTPEKALVGEIISANVLGLTDCRGKTVTIGQDGCNDKIADMRCSNSDCSAGTSFRLGVSKNYKLAACIDKDSDKYYISQGERSYAYVNIIDQPDVTFGELNTIEVRAGKVFAVNIPVKNAGSRDVYECVLSYKLINSAGYSTIDRSKLVKQITAGGEQVVTLPSLTLSSGTYTLNLELDKPVLDDDKVKEFDEGNNKAILKIVVT